MRTYRSVEYNLTHKDMSMRKKPEEGSQGKVNNNHRLVLVKQKMKTNELHELKFSGLHNEEIVLKRKQK